MNYNTIVDKIKARDITGLKSIYQTKQFQLEIHRAALKICFNFLEGSIEENEKSYFRMVANYYGLNGQAYLNNLGTFDLVLWYTEIVDESNRIEKNTFLRDNLD